MKLAELNRKPIWRSLYKAGADREKKFTAVLNCALAGDDWDDDDGDGRDTDLRCEGTIQHRGFR
jgi:hypothetical protein